MLFSIGRRHDLVDICCNGVRKLCKSLEAENSGLTRGSQSIKIDIGKSFDKSISIDKLNLNDIDFIGQLIKFDTHTPTKC